MFLDPNHLLTLGLIARPVLIDWGNEALFLTFQRIPYGIAGGWRAGYIVIAPDKISGSLHVTGKVDHIIISQGIEAILVLQYLMILVAQGFLEGLDAGSRRGENHGMATLLGILGIEEIAIHRMSQSDEARYGSPNE